MKSFGSINISNSYIEKIINNYSVISKKDEAKDKGEEADNDESAEFVEVQPVPTEKPISVQGSEAIASKLIRLIINKDIAQRIMEWLHVTMDPLDDPRSKLIYLRAICEAGYFPRLISYPDYCEEFGYMAKSSYYDWMGTKLNYEQSEIDGIIEHFPFR